MWQFQKPIPEAYDDIISGLACEEPTGSRLGGTKEKLSVTVRSNNPRKRIMMRPNVNWAFGLQECFAYWTGANPGDVERYNSNMERYIQEDGEMLGSAYGRYLRHLPHDQISRVIEQLEESSGTRRAVINVHNAAYEEYDSNDVACTVYLQFLVRDEQLNCIAALRSQDMLWGFPYDTQAFQWIQEVVAGILDLDLGWYEHRMNSCHYYLDFEDSIFDSRHPDVYELPDCRLEEINLRIVESVLGSGLERAKEGVFPIGEIHQLDTIDRLYSDWLRMMTAYEMHRFHDDIERAEDISERMEVRAFRDWLTSSVLSS